jgi:hypothetical protein
LAERAVRAVVVVMVLVLAKHGCGVPQVDDEDAVEEFAADAADEAFGDRVGSRCLHRCLDDPDVECGEHGVEDCGELGVTVPDEKPEAAAGVLEIHKQVASLLSQPGSGGMGGDAEDVYAPGGVLDDKEDMMKKKTYSRRKVIVSRWNTSQARMACACAWRNSLHEGPARRGDGSMPAWLRSFQTVEAPIW